MQVEAITSAKATLRESLLSTIRLDSQGRFFEGSCSLCRSKYREEAEGIHANPPGPGDRDRMLQDFFVSKGETVSITDVRHHCDNHMGGRASEELRRAEYMENLLALVNADKGNLDRLKLSLAALEERLYATAAIAGSSIKVQAQKTKDVVALTKSVASTIQLMAELQGEMHDRGEMVSIPKNKFKEAIENALRQTKSVEEQQTLIRVFEGIHQASKE